MSVQPNLSRRQARWLEKMSRFGNFEVLYKSGNTNPANGLSRIYEGSEPATLAFMNALTDWHITPCMAAMSELAPDAEVITRIAANSASDPWIQKHKSKLQDTPDGCYTFHGLMVVP